MCWTVLIQLTDDTILFELCGVKLIFRQYFVATMHRIKPNHSQYLVLKQRYASYITILGQSPETHHAESRVRVIVFSPQDICLTRH